MNKYVSLLSLPFSIIHFTAKSLFIFNPPSYFLWFSFSHIDYSLITFILYVFNRLARFLETAGSVLNYFEPFLGRIEILGGSKKIERVYFEIKESNIEQWEKPQIKVWITINLIFTDDEVWIGIIILWNWSMLLIITSYIRFISCIVTDSNYI